MKKLSLYLIDDSEVNNATVNQVAKKNERIGEITSFLNAKIALNQIISDFEKGNKLPDLIFLDIQMPEMDGFEWIDEIDEVFDEFEPIIILVSATNQIKDFESLTKQRLGKEIVKKPITEVVVNDLVCKYFNEE